MSVVRVVLTVETIFEHQGLPEVVRIVEPYVIHNFDGEVSWARIDKVEELPDERSTDAE